MYTFIVYIAVMIFNLFLISSIISCFSTLMVWIRNVTYCLKHLNVWPSAGATVSGGLGSIWPCSRKYTSLGKKFEVKKPPSRFICSLCLVLAVLDVRSQLPPLADMTWQAHCTGTISSNKLFLLYGALVMDVYHSQRQVTSAEVGTGVWVDE